MIQIIKNRCRSGVLMVKYDFVGQTEQFSVERICQNPEIDTKHCLFYHQEQCPKYREREK